LNPLELLSCRFQPAGAAAANLSELPLPIELLKLLKLSDLLSSRTAKLLELPIGRTA
jgi:hypothetical protein